MMKQISPFLILSLLTLMLVSATATEQSSFQPWRSSANGGINALYCYLQANGVQCNYSDLVAAQEKVGTQYTAGTIARLATENGLPMQAVSLTVEELYSCSMPILVHMDGESLDSGAFLLILSISEKSIHYLNGPTATIHAMSREDFRRVWSGIALLPKKQQRRNTLFAAVGLCAGLIVPVMHRSAKSRKKQLG